ncbi:fimbrial protein [Burkholderia cepacia]|uniref:Fimbrial protein n=2 Tax=Burkholderia cepacia TaxID=292 RepID=A0AAQ0FHM3_BURCE|nr:Fimbrial protein [Burkholderia cepacia]RAQ16211.1 fimbrial protein [Burkholderia cepacia]
MNMKKLTIGLTASVLAISSSAALAALTCKTYSGGSNIPSPDPVVVTLAAYNAPSFDPEVPNGTIIASQEASLVSGGAGEVACESYIYKVRHGTLSEASDPTYHTLPTTVSGVGVRMRFSSGGNTDWWPWEFTLPGVREITFTSIPVVIELVKTGRITAGGSLSGELAGSWVKNSLGESFKYRIFKLSGSIQIKPTVPTCAVTTKTVNVPFGEVSMTDTAGGPEKSFKIGLKCSGGTGTAKTRMYITLTDATKSANRSNILNLTSNSTAEGVGIQIKNGSTLVSYGPDSSAKGNPNQWFVTETGNAEIEIPLTARYVRTGAKLKGGTADGIATFTMSYQ